MEINVKCLPHKLPGSLWGITTFFNPANYHNKIENYKAFRICAKRQGLSLVTVELAFGNTPFALNSNDTDILLQLRTSLENVLWQKEALLNIALKHLPQDCDKVVWLDCDIIFKNENWIKETIAQLEKYIVVQPYAYVVSMPRGIQDIPDPQHLPKGLMDGEIIHSIAYGVSHCTHTVLGNYALHGHTGYAWAARRELLNKYGFYDRMVLGTGDVLMAYAFYNNINSYTEKRLTPHSKKNYFSWFEKISPDVQNSVGYTEGTILHLWHGEHSRRLYRERHLIEKRHDFDPETDIKKDPQGIWEWSSSKPDFHQDVKDYFKKRSEEASSPLQTLSKPKFRRLQRVMQKMVSSARYRYSEFLCACQKVTKSPH